ncbi:MAG: class I SAM-dependent methyltransferase [Nocardiopsaceae bacterium]|jgi:SAM-dependent methyltransferase|nr:class I SAM-dependent methyltransferase [Nocardiopsaceae bacterium]
MSLAYRIMYRLGLTPWEQTDPPEPLAALVEGPEALTPGAMLDVGCGTGHYAIYCARKGWNVTGIDVVPRALSEARRNASSAGVEVRFLQADISRASGADVGARYSLLTDIGCLHGLPAAKLANAVATITGAASPGATMLMFAVSPGLRAPLPRGIDPDEIPVLFPDWKLVSQRPATDVALQGPMRRATPFWYQLERL